MSLFNYTYKDFFNPIIRSMHILGGSASIPEIEDAIINILNLSEGSATEIYKGNVTKLSYELAVARNFLKKIGLIESSTRGIWALTSMGTNTLNVDPDEIILIAGNLFSQTEIDSSLIENEIALEFENDSNSEILELEWQEQLLKTLKTLSPSKFEWLCQRLLRELGFINVEVTGKVGDGGIDGKGILKIGSVLSFFVVFQCKRYQGGVAAEEIRGFRGALEGRADKGLFITTGHFTKEARKEASRDGAKFIDLIDGLQLAEKLKETGLGIKTELIEKIHVNVEWFDNF
ncbi:MAG: Mrr restriction system protein [Mucilaginibacter sp.]|nr:Mrr restriction system protein [Mucilaginibacter sp.]